MRKSESVARYKWRALALGTASFLAMSATARAQDNPDQPQPPADAAEIVVTGSRIARSGFTAPTPVTVLGADRAEKLGITNVADLLNNTPLFRATSTPQTSSVFPSNVGARILDLRGLGPERTLVLVDGRRFVPSTNQGTVDLNLIPSALVQRSEVVTGGASAAYGSDAVAGVVNLILDTRMKGIRGQISYGQTDHNDAENYQASLAAGTSFASGRGHLVIGGEYENAQRAGTCYSRDWCAEEWSVVNNPFGAGFGGYPAQVIARNVHAATTTPGGMIFLGPLAGTQFGPDGQPTIFNFGELPGLPLMIGGDGAGRNPIINDFYLSNPVKRYSLLAHAEYEFSSSASAFVEASFGHVDGRGLSVAPRDFGIPGLGIPIGVDNAFLPAATRTAMENAGVASFTMGRVSEDLGFALNRSVTDTYRIATGIDGHLGDNWRWNAYYQYGHSTYAQTTDNSRNNANFARAVNAVFDDETAITPGMGTIVCADTLSPDPAARAAAVGCSPLNLFGENRFSPDARNYVYSLASQRTVFSQHVVAGNVQGDLFEGWAGPITVAVGIEHREDKARGTQDPISAANGFYSDNGSPVTGEVKVTEGYLETVVPLLKNEGFARSLELNGAVRQTHYSTSGRVTTWKAGLVYDPVQDIRLRATRSRDIRAPNINELFRPLSRMTNPLLNPFDNNVQFQPDSYTGGNPDLKPERADTWTVGVVLQPRWISGLRASIDYYNIRIDGAIATMGAQAILNRCHAGALDLCGLIVDGDDNPSTISGVITAVNAPLLNINTFKTSGLDFEIDYRLSLDRVSRSLPGTLSIRLLVTYVDELVRVDSAGPRDTAGMNGAPLFSGLGSGVPNWSGNLLITYDNGRFSMSAEGRYIHKGKFDVTAIGPDDPDYSVMLPNSISDNTIPSVFYLNLAAQYDLLSSSGRSVQLFGAINNVFDKDPPIAPGVGGNVTNPALYDQLGRTYRIGIRVKY